MENFIKRKKLNKNALADKLGFAAKKPVVGIVLEEELSKKEEENLMKLLEGLAEMDLQVLVAADGSYENLTSKNVMVLPYNQGNREEVIGACDMALCFEFTDVEEMLLNGSIPVSAARKELSDYNPNQESGNAFIFKKKSAWSIFAAVVRALETFKFPYDWASIVRHGMESVKSEEAKV